jgi:hypothetical protein
MALESINRSSIVRDAKLFHLMRDLYFDDLAMVDRRQLLQTIKYEALKRRSQEKWLG